MKCKAVCCKTIPLPSEIFEKHKPVREILILVKRGDGMSTPTTKDGYCPFLGEDMKCSIYEDRPWLCKLYGKGGHLFLECPWQAPDGRIRERGERRHIEHKVEKLLLKQRGHNMGYDARLKLAQESLAAVRLHMGEDFKPF